MNIIKEYFISFNSICYIGSVQFHYLLIHERSPHYYHMMFTPLYLTFEPINITNELKLVRYHT